MDDGVQSGTWGPPIRMIADRLIPVVRFPSTRDGETNRRILVAVSDLEALVAKRREPAR